MFQLPEQQSSQRLGEEASSDDGVSNKDSSLDSEDDYCSGSQNVSHQQQSL